MNETADKLKEALDILNELLHEVAFVPGVQSSASAWGLREKARKAQSLLKENGYDMSQLGEVTYVSEQQAKEAEELTKALADFLAEEKQ